jgi:hypothetical protein
MTTANPPVNDSKVSPVFLPPKMTFGDYFDAVRCRTSNGFRMNFKTTPGLYALGKPDKDSPVLVTANYTLSVNSLRAELEGRNVWILVIDTQGINVWCAAGKGTFCTKGIVKEINACNLNDIVAHRTLVLPQLGASGVNAAKLQKESGFKVKFGPVRAKDIPYYLDNNYTAAKEMRRVAFTTIDRIKLVPMEFIPEVKPVFLFLLAAAILFGITRTGVMFGPALMGVAPLALAGIIAVLTGTVLTPVLLPIIPFRAFTLKGFLLGAIGAITLVITMPPIRANLPLAALCLLAVPSLSSYFAFLFTGSTTYTSPSGVKSELKKAWPLYIASAGISIVLFIWVLVKFWGII